MIIINIFLKEFFIGLAFCATVKRNSAENKVCGTGQGACCAGSNDGCPTEAPVCSEWGYCQCASYQPGGPECGPGFDYYADPEQNDYENYDYYENQDDYYDSQGVVGNEVEQNEGQICGTGQGACCAGSNDGCPTEAPVCSEWGYCQCASYQPGGPECGPGFDYYSDPEQNDYDSYDSYADPKEDYQDDSQGVVDNEINDNEISNTNQDRGPNENEADQKEEQVCGKGIGACCAGSNDGCPTEAPVCSEWGYCQCASYQPGGLECGPGFDSKLNQAEIGMEEMEGKICGKGQGACCAGSNDGCPTEAPVCSEWGYCQCASYQPGGPECGPGF